jgi:hypothetical protein
MLKPCFPSQLKDFPFKDEDVADIWRIAKAEFIDKGASFDETVRGMADLLGMRHEHIAQAFTMPKVRRVVSNDMWQKQQRRRDAINHAKMMVESVHDPALLKKIRDAYNVPRAALVAGHGGVFPMTHMGQSLFVPTEWKTFFRASANAWRSMSPKQYEIAIQRHLADPDYMAARRASKSVDPTQPTVGILNRGGKSHWADRGFNSLKIARLDLFKQMWHKLESTERTPENAKAIMNVVDHATGEVHLGKAGAVMAKVFFAPKLIPARFMAAVVDPIKAVGTVANWRNASAGERAAARFVMKRQVQTVAFYAGALALNQGLNEWLGSKDKVNFTDPTKSDWLSFKIAGLNVRPPNAVIETIRLAGGLIAPFFASDKTLRGESPSSAAAHRVADYFRYKLHPTIQTGLELAQGADLFKRPTPYPGLRELATGNKPKASASHPAISWPEYILGKGPIPGGAAVREFYDLLREQGMNHMDARKWLRIISVGATESLGIQAHEQRPTNPSSQPATSRHR